MRLLRPAVLSAALTFGCTPEPQLALAPPTAPELNPPAKPATSAPGEPPPADAEWTVRAEAGGASLSQAGAPPGPCVLTARRDGAVLWTAPICLARRGQPVFHFDGRDWPRSAAESRAAARKGKLDIEDESTLYRWEDAQGGLHFTLARDVPAALASKARPVTADIGSVTSGSVTSGSVTSGPRSPVTAISPGVLNGLTRSYRPEAPDPSKGPRLNGLTDAEREEQERSRALAAERARKAEEEQSIERQRRLREALDRSPPPTFMYPK